MISRTYYPRTQYLDSLFSWDVCAHWIDGFWYTNLQKIYQIQRNKTTRDAYQFLTLIRDFLAHHVYLLHGSSAPRSGDTDTFLGTRIYGVVYEKRYAFLQTYYHRYY